MDVSGLTLFQGIKQKMDWLTQRQTVLAENISNANTPGYSSRDLKAPNFRSLVKEVPQVAVAATNAQHMQGIRRPTEFRAEQDNKKSPFEVTINENTVSLEQQLLKVSETQADYRLVTSLYTQHLSMMKMAVGRQPGM